MGRLDILAICDHDTISGVLDAAARLPEGLRLIPGIEVSSSIAGRDLHLLGYGIDVTNARLLEYTTRAALARSRRMREMIDRLAPYNVRLSYDDVVAAAEVPPQCIGRPHLARALFTRGHVKSIAEAFDRFIGNDAPAYVPVELLQPAEAIALLHDAGGVVLWAHPRMDVFDREVRGLQQVGLDGVECYRPRLTPSEVQYYETAANDLGLLKSGGSDWHGSWHGPLGDFAIGDVELAPLLARL